MNQVTEDPVAADALEADCYAFAVRRAARAVTSHYDAALKPAGLRITQLGILHAVARQQPAALTDLSARLGVDRTTLTRNLGPLEREALLSIHDAPDDRRSRVVSLTDHGAAKLSQAIPLWRSAQEELARRFGRDRADRLRADLQALAATDPDDGRQLTDGVDGGGTAETGPRRHAPHAHHTKENA